MNDLLSLGLTLIIGLFILFGTIIVFLIKNNDKFIEFTIGASFSVMVMLSAFEIMPEAFELIETKNNTPMTIFMLIVFILIGMLILKLLDYFIPHHVHDEHHIHKDNLHHIGIVSGVAIILHNIIEGIAVYGTVINSYKMGLLMCLGVGLHNIPMGMIIGSTLYKSNKSIHKTLIYSLLVSLSSFLGGLSIYIFNINDYLLGILLSITLGMIIYIAIIELLPHIIENIKKKTTIIGLIVGILILIISILL